MTEEERRRENKERYQKNRERRLATVQRQRARLRAEEPWRLSLVGVKARAKKKGIPYDLDAAWGEARWTGRCELTGLPFDLEIIPGRTGPRTLSPSIDKIDPAQGYVKTNCRFVVFCVNALKSDGTEEQMYAVAELLLANRLR